MKKRPLSLTIISIWLAIGSAMSVWAVTSMAGNPISIKMVAQSGLPLILFQVNAAIGGIVTAASAYGIWKGLAWSRLFYLGWSVIGLAFSLLTSPAKSVTLLGAMFVVVIGFFLFRAAANRWFSGESEDSEVQGS